MAKSREMQSLGLHITICGTECQTSLVSGHLRYPPQPFPMMGAAEQGAEHRCAWGGSIRLPPVFAGLTLRKRVWAPEGQPAFKERHESIGVDCQQRKEASFGGWDATAVEQEYCLDPTLQSNCFHQPQLQHLGPGCTVLFGVQPKFTNVDIRITLDVTFGGVDLFISTAYDTFAVDVDPATGRHLVRLQTPHAAGANTTRLQEECAGGLVTYVTVREAAAALVVRGVRDWLVLTYPHALHPLKSSRFYLLLLGVGGPRGGPSQGLLFFRQDQAHIDLFVVFSVFFSCFFLLLALCVLLWKAKQGLDARHEQRRHLQEMSKMASRPFAKVTICFEWGAPLGPRPAAAALPPPRHPPQPGAGPVTLEPTEDGVAAVATLLLQLPGEPWGPHRAALASALVTLRQGLQEYGGGPPACKEGLAHELTSMAI
ncbi:multiple epidermal growth factor-like domains protein 8 [Morus bassanus]